MDFKFDKPSMFPKTVQTWPF